MKRPAHSFTDQLLVMTPAGIGALLVLAGALPPVFPGLSFYPEMLVLLTCFFVIYYPAAWPIWVAFLLGLLEDLVSGAALGTHALLAMLLTLILRRRSARLNRQNFRMLWLEVTAMTLGYLLLLWLILSWVAYAALPLMPLVHSLVVTVLWFPPLYFLLGRFLPYLPSASMR